MNGACAESITDQREGHADQPSPIHVLQEPAETRTGQQLPSVILRKICLRLLCSEQASTRTPFFCFFGSLKAPDISLYRFTASYCPSLNLSVQNYISKIITL